MRRPTDARWVTVDPGASRLKRRWLRGRQPMWVKLFALALVPLLAVASLSYSIVGGRVSRMDAAERVADEAAAGAPSADLSVDAYFDSYSLMAGSSLRAYLAAVPGARAVLAAEDVRLEAKLAADAALIRSDRAENPQMRKLLAPLERALAEQRSGGSTAAVADEMRSVGETALQISGQSLSDSAVQANGVPGSTNLVQAIGTIEDTDNLNSDMISILSALFIMGSTSSASTIVSEQGVLGYAVYIGRIQLGYVDSDLVGVGLSGRVDTSVYADILDTSKKLSSMNLVHGVPYSYVSEMFAQANSYGAEAESVNKLEMAKVQAVTAAIRRQVISSSEDLIAEIAALVGLTLLLTFLVQRSLRRPMIRLASRATRISDGNLELGDERGSSEIAALAVALNDAIKNLTQIKAQAEALGQGDLTNPVLNEPVPGGLGESLFSSVAQATELQRRLGYRATHDPLTGLLNREAAYESLEAALVAGRADGTPVGALFIDLDGFKTLNDSYGHAFGDQVLQSVGRRIVDAAGSDALTCRLGGDEFLVVVAEADGLADVRTRAARILDAVSEPLAFGDVAVTVRASVGAAMSDASNQCHASQLLRRADVAVYRAKTAGRDQVCLFDPKEDDSPLPASAGHSYTR